MTQVVPAGPAQLTGTLALVPLALACPALAPALPPELAVNVAVTPCSELIVTAHVPVPLQPPPDQPLKVEPDAGVAVSVTIVPLG
jgi:hypothetical protein